jgi:hypothetical protein
LAHFHPLLSDFSTEPVAVAPHVDDHTVMKQAVQECRDNDRILKQLGPVGEGFVGGDNGAGLLVPIASPLIEPGEIESARCLRRVIPVLE